MCYIKQNESEVGTVLKKMLLISEMYFIQIYAISNVKTKHLSQVHDVT